MILQWLCLLLVTLLCVYNDAQGEGTCPDGYSIIAGQCLSVIRFKPKFHKDAEIACNQQAGTLARPKDPQGLLHYYKQKNYKVGMWVGASDANEEGLWKWSNGELLPADFPWAEGEPNIFYGNEDFAILTKTGFADYPGSLDAFYICEPLATHDAFLRLAQQQANNAFSPSHHQQQPSFHQHGQPYNRPEQVNDIPSFDAFCEMYKKNYTNEKDRELRHGIYDSNCEEIRAHNAHYDSGKVSYKKGVNEYSHLIPEEVRSSLTGSIPKQKTEETKDLYKWYEPDYTVDYQPSIDYRKYVTRIRNQKECASCWAFSAISSIESQIYKTYNQHVVLSEQYLIDCSKGFGFPNEADHDGCGTGWTSGAMEYANKNHIAYEKSYNYIAKGGTCNKATQKTLFRVKGILEVTPENDEELLNALVRLGPIAVSLYTPDSFHHYGKEGVFADESCSGHTETNHAVLLVGYGEERTTGNHCKKYWLIRNSWGESWGWNGYMKLCREIHNYCQISSKPYIPVIERILQGHA